MGVDLKPPSRISSARFIYWVFRSCACTRHTFKFNLMADTVGLQVVKYEGGITGFMKKLFIWFQKNEHLKGIHTMCCRVAGYDIQKTRLPIARNAPLLHLIVYE
jgi:hypothetical protein